MQRHITEHFECSVDTAITVKSATLLWFEFSAFHALAVAQYSNQLE